MKVVACLLALSLAACASAAPTPPPKVAQQGDDVPIRTPDEIARDQRGGPLPADSDSTDGAPSPSTCRKYPNVPGCPGAPKRGPLDNTTTRSPRLVNAR